MAGPYERPSDQTPVVGVIDPDAYAAGTYTTGWISMADHRAILAAVMVGDMGASGTVDAKLEQATDGSGTGAKDVTGKSIAQLTKAGTDDNKQALINCRADELDITNSFTHVRLSMTVGTAASDAGAVVLGFNSRYQPGADLATVDEIVS